jgi:hypothetical protein
VDMLLESIEAVGVVGVFRGDAAVSTLPVPDVTILRAIEEVRSGPGDVIETGDSTITDGGVWISAEGCSAETALVLRATGGRGFEIIGAVGGFEGPFRGAILVYTAQH